MRAPAPSIVLVAVTVLSATATGSSEHCISRIFPDYSGTVETSEDGCPYSINSDEWSPGQPTQMDIEHQDGEPFQLFIVSVQHGNTLVGVMSSDDAAAVETCRNTSLQHSDLRNKTRLELTWTAPANLPEGDPILRLSIGTEKTFWKDCEVYYLVKKEMGETTPRLAGPDTANSQRLAPPDTANGGTTTPSNSDSTAYSCEQYGNIYTIVANSNCTIFKQNPGSHEFKCPSNLKFNIKDCVCSHGWNTKCEI